MSTIKGRPPPDQEMAFPNSDLPQKKVLRMVDPLVRSIAVMNYSGLRQPKEGDGQMIGACLIGPWQKPYYAM